MGKTRHTPPTVDDIDPPSPYEMMMRDADYLARKLAAFREHIREGGKDDIWLNCWRRNFQQLSDVINQTLRIERTKGAET